LAKDVEIYATSWTLYGDAIPGITSEVARFGFRERAEAARKAGFAGLGLVHEDYVHLRDKHSLVEMKAILADNGMRLIETECLTDWFATGDRRRQSDVVRRDLIEGAKNLGSRHIKVIGDVVDPSDDAWPIDHMAKEFAKLCADAADAGLIIAFELMPHANIKNLGQGMEIVQASGAKNGGLLLDVWHVVRGGIAYADIAALPKGAIVWVELDDADKAQVGSLHEDTVYRRRLCGEGSFDIPGFLRAVGAAGYDDAYGVEMISDQHRRLSVDEAARVAYRTTRHQFDLI
jgi:sugar phosphate isomerase/epimerase